MYLQHAIDHHLEESPECLAKAYLFNDLNLTQTSYRSVGSELAPNAANSLATIVNECFRIIQSITQPKILPKTTYSWLARPQSRHFCVTQILSIFLALSSNGFFSIKPKLEFAQGGFNYNEKVSSSGTKYTVS